MLALLVLVALALLVVGPFLSIIAFARAKAVDGLSTRIETLEAEVAELRRRVRAGAAPGATASPAPAPPKPAVLPVAAQPVRPPSPPRAPEPPPTPPSPPIDWERWIGIRGAAVLGAIVLALAGLLFFQYSIQHGLITPAMRVVLGLGVGIFAIVASELLRPRGYQQTPEALAGAGVVVLYAALWAGHALYHLIPMAVCFGLMILVTATCGLLAVRHTSQLVAVLGLLGGFATPLLLGSRSDRPIGLFGYVLLLDIGLLAVGRRRSWPWLSLLGLAGTVLLQGLWIGARMGPERMVLGLLILGVFALVFTAAGFLGGGGGTNPAFSRMSQAGALLLPFAFAVYFASRVDLGPHLWPVAVLLAMLSAGASWVGKRQSTPLLPLAASIANLGVFAVWLSRAAKTEGAAWESVGIGVALALIFHVFVELDPEPAGIEGPAPAALVSAFGFFVLLIAASVRMTDAPLWTWLAGWMALSVVLYRHAGFPGRAALQVVAVLGTAVGLSLQHLVHSREASFPGAATVLGIAVALAVATQIVAFSRRTSPAGPFADHAAAAFAAVFAFSLAPSPMLTPTGPALALGVPLILGVLVLLAATRLGSGGWIFAALFALTAVQLSWGYTRPELATVPGEARAALAIVLAGCAVFVFWPFAGGGALRRDPLAWKAAALAAPLAFLPAKHLWRLGMGSAAIGALPLIFGGLALAGAAGARRASIPEGEARRSALVWLSAVSILFASVAIPLQLDKSWVTVGWALEGLALILLWRRMDHPGLKWLALAHLAAVTIRLVPTAVLLESYPRSPRRIVNWVLYTYLVPAAAMFAGAWLLARDELGRIREWERPFYANGKPAGAVAAAISGIFVVFVWINLAIADWFADGPRLTLDFGRSPARDLTVSIAWALYALVLLGFGMARANIGLRWLSLSFLVVTIGKVFLYDLGELRDLYRVVSLVGLAVSLLLVSLLYQRFVFRRPAPDRT